MFDTRKQRLNGTHVELQHAKPEELMKFIMFFP